MPASRGASKNLPPAYPIADEGAFIASDLNKMLAVSRGALLTAIVGFIKKAMAKSA